MVNENAVTIIIARKILIITFFIKLCFSIVYNLFIAVQKLRLAPEILLANQTFITGYLFRNKIKI